MNLTVATWNLEWAPAQSARGREIRERLAASEADVVCVTEAHAENLPEGGDLVESDADYGYPLREGRRKVILWTRHKWEQRDVLGSHHLPPGRFAAGTILVGSRAIRFVGVCIPWSAAHVTTGRRDRARWQDHLSYLDGLGAYLEQASETPTIILGDFNQAIPRFRQPIRLARSLETNILGRGLKPISRDLLCESGLPLIDHICVSQGLSGEVIAQFPKRSDGMRLSDHTGIIARIGAHPAG